MEKFFAYIAEELKIGKSKSALQLSALEDTKVMLQQYQDDIYNKIGDCLCNINIQAELGEDFLETGEENIFWTVNDVSVEKEERIAIYYANLDISVLADLIYQEEGDYP